LFASLERKRKLWKNGRSKWRTFGREELLGIHFLHNTKSFSFRDLTNCIGWGLGGFREFK